MSKLLVFRGWRAILNVHERSFPVPAASLGRLVDSLSSSEDRLWPHEQWPPMRLRHGLTPGSCGGHSKISYTVGEYIPARRVEFQFDPMAALPAFDGRHYFEVIPHGGESLLRHTIDVRTNLWTWIYWKIFVEHVHDAVLEDAFDKAERSLGLPHPHRSQWSLHVRLLRWLRQRQATASQGKA